MTHDALASVRAVLGRESMPLAPAEIARYTGLTRSRATTAIRRLMEMGEVIRNEAGYVELAGKRYV